MMVKCFTYFLFCLWTIGHQGSSVSGQESHATCNFKYACYNPATPAVWKLMDNARNQFEAAERINEHEKQLGDFYAQLHSDTEEMKTKLMMCMNPEDIRWRKGPQLPPSFEATYTNLTIEGRIDTYVRNHHKNLELAIDRLLSAVHKIDSEVRNHIIFEHNLRECLRE